MLRSYYYYYYYKQQWMVVVKKKDLINHGRTTSGNGQASRCRHCCASQVTEVDGQSSQRMHLSELPNKAWTSRVLVVSQLYKYGDFELTTLNCKANMWTVVNCENAIVLTLVESPTLDLLQKTSDTVA